MWQNAVDSVNIFDDDNQFLPDSDTYVNEPTRNGFVKVKFHWSEDPKKDAKWYQDQKRDLNFDTRLINQELDLVFVGSTNCIFSDDFLSQLNPQKPIDRIKLPHECTFNLYTHRQEFDKTDYFLLGCDTAKSLIGDYNALELYSYSNFIQMGEFFGRLGSLTKYSEVLMALIKILAPITNNRLILCIECNSIGAAIIENLENATDFDYMQFVYSPDPDKRIGIATTSKSKSSMVSFLYDYMVDDPQNVKSSDLINQLNIIERKVNGSVSAQSGYNDDLFMAAALCAYTRRLSSLEYEPLLGISTILQQQQKANVIKSSIALASSNPTQQNQNSIGIKINGNEGSVEYLIYDTDDDSGGYDDAFAIF